jgi:hypothetical protein
MTILFTKKQREHKMDNDEKLKKQLLLKLKDIENSQVALIEKLAVVQLDLDDFPIKEVVDVIVKAHSEASNNLDLIKNVTEKVSGA